MSAKRHPLQPVRTSASVHPLTLAATEASCDRGKLRQRLSSHLEACVCVAVQTDLTGEDFPFDLALEVLRAQEKDRYVEEKGRKH